MLPNKRSHRHTSKSYYRYGDIEGKQVVNPLVAISVSSLSWDAFMEYNPLLFLSQLDAGLIEGSLELVKNYYKLIF